MRNTRIFYSFMVIITSLMVITGCYQDNKPEPQIPNTVSWTIMYYVDADCDLEQYLLNDLNEIESVNVENQKIRIIALVDRSPKSPTVVDGGYSNQDGDWADTRAYEMSFDSDGYNKTLVSKRIAIPSLKITADSTNVELNMGDMENLQKFVSFCKQNYLSDKYMLILTNHGDGILTESTTNLPATKAICFDETSELAGDPRSSLTVKDLKKALVNSKVDVIALDACLMATVEVAYGLRDVADILVASGELIPGFGFPYRNILQAINSYSGDITPTVISKIIIDQYYNAYTYGTNIEMPGGVSSKITLSAIDLKKMNDLSFALNNLGNVLYNTQLNSTPQIKYLSLIYDTEKFYNIHHYNYLDINDFCVNISNIYWKDYYKTENDAVRRILNDSIIYNRVGSNYQKSYGLSIYFPVVSTTVNYNQFSVKHDPYYTTTSAELEFANDTPGWVKYVRSLKSD